MEKENRKKSGCGCILGLIIVAILAFVITILVLYSMDPVKLQNSVNDAAEKMQAYLDEMNGVKRNSDDNLEFPEKEELTEAQRYYYYQQLSDTAKKIYVSIENNVEKLKNGEDNIPLPASLNEDAKSNVGGKDYIAKEFQAAWDAFMTDKSEYFYLDSSKVCLVTKMTTKGSNTNYEFAIGKGNNSNYFIDEFDSKEEVDNAIKKVESEKNNIIKNATGNNYEKMKYIHNWIVENVKYDVMNSENNSNIYGCLVDKNVVCEGYARTYKYLLDELNIPCVLVSVTAVDNEGNSERHAWNYVYIKNNWYAIDVTWDDPIIIGNGRVDEEIRYKYFLKGSNTMNKDHKTNGKITKEGLEFIYPELSTEDIK